MGLRGVSKVCPIASGKPPRLAREVTMAAHAANRAPTSTRRSTVPIGDPILTSKITAPDVPAWAVQRPRITERIAEGTRWCPLTVVTGPAGAGKTMAVAMWAAGEADRVAWVCLDEFDNRPGMFWSYVLASLSRCGVIVPRTLRSAVRGREGDDGIIAGSTTRIFEERKPAEMPASFSLVRRPS